MIALSFVALALVSVQWVLVGYSLAFSSDIAGFVGGSGFLGLNGVGMDCGDLTIPHLAFMVFQLAFAAITLAILTSAMAERVKLRRFIVFGLLWTTLVYLMKASMRGQYTVSAGYGVQLLRVYSQLKW